jgi:hypothetical protein
MLPLPLAININGHNERIVFKVVRITHPLMVGLPWLCCHNPTIECHPLSVEFSSLFCLSHCHTPRTRRPYVTGNRRISVICLVTI